MLFTLLPFKFKYFLRNRQCYSYFILECSWSVSHKHCVVNTVIVYFLGLSVDNYFCLKYSTISNFWGTLAHNRQGKSQLYIFKRSGPP